MLNQTRKQILLVSMKSAEQATARAARYIMRHNVAMALDSIAAARSWVEQLESIGADVSEMKKALQELTEIALAA